MKKFEFTEYNGHRAGYASWLLSSLLTDNENAADMCYRIFQQEPLEQAHTEFASFLRKMIAAWTVGETVAYPHVIQAWAENTFGYLCKSAFWGPIYDALRGAAFFGKKPLKTHGVHRGRVAVRASGSFRVASVDGINARYCRVVQRADGYEMGLVPPQEPLPARPTRNASFLPMPHRQGYPEAEV